MLEEESAKAEVLLAFLGHVGHKADSEVVEQAVTALQVRLPKGLLYNKIIKTHSKNNTSDTSLGLHPYFKEPPTFYGAF